MNESIQNKTTNSFFCVGLGNCRGYERGKGRKEALSVHIGNASHFVSQFAHFDKMSFITSTQSFTLLSCKHRSYYSTDWINWVGDWKNLEPMMQ